IFEDELDDEIASQPGRLPSAVRVVERFRTRLAPGVVFGDPSQLQGPGVSTPTSTWVPELGPEPLHVRFRAYLVTLYPTLEALNTAWGVKLAGMSTVVLPPTRPDNPVMAADWSRFLI